MDRNQFLQDLRDVVRRLEAMLLESEAHPTRKLHRKVLICASCMSQKGGKKAAQMFTKEQRSRWSKDSGGGRPPQDGQQRKDRKPRKQMVQDSVAGASVQSSKAQPASPDQSFSIDPTKLYKTGRSGSLL